MDLHDPKHTYVVIRNAVAAPRWRHPSRAMRGWCTNSAAKAATVFCVCLVLCTAYLLAYPTVTCCRWKLEDPTARFLILADPQMEGSDKVRRHGVFGKLDLALNDAYVRHVFTSLVRHHRPSHTVVLGDLFSSQWISDSEFNDRARRYKQIFWGATPFGGATPADLSAPLLINLTGNHDIGYEADLTERMVQRWEDVFGDANFEFTIGPDNARLEAMEPTVYGLEILRNRALRNVVEDGPIRSNGTVHFVVVNSMALDSRKIESLHYDTWRFLSSVAEQRHALEGPVPPLVLLMHIPLHKREGICFDAPITRRNSGGYILEQNLLVPETSHLILSLLRPAWVFAGHDHEGCVAERIVWRRRRPRVVSADGYVTFPGAAEGETNEVMEETQEGAGQAAYLSRWRFRAAKENEEWEYVECVRKLEEPTVDDYMHGEVPADCPPLPSESEEDGGAWKFLSAAREVTVRAVMAEFGGHASLWEFSATPGGTPKFSYTTCPFANHFFVWSILIADVLTAAVTAIALLLACCRSKRLRRRFLRFWMDHLSRQRNKTGRID